jgi:hypothetical protein
MGQTSSMAIHRSALRSWAAPLDALEAVRPDQNRMHSPVICLHLTNMVGRWHGAAFGVFGGRLLGHQQIVGAAQYISARRRCDPVVRPQLKAKRSAAPILMRRPSDILLRLRPCGHLGKLVGIQQAYGIGLPLDGDRAQRGQLALVEAPPIEFEPRLAERDRLHGALFLPQPSGIDEPPELHANPRGFVGAAMASGKM